MIGVKKPSPALSKFFKAQKVFAGEGWGEGNLKRRFYFSQLLWLLLSFFILIIDQLTKHLALRTLILYKPLPLTAFFNLTLAHNTGAAFSFLDHAGKSGVLFLTLFALVMSIFILIWLLRLPKNSSWLSIALSLILGGALGNLLDRVRYGYVIDFMDVYIHQWHWPAFNIADSAICAGVFILCLICTKK